MHSTDPSEGSLRNLALICLDNIEELIEAFLAELIELEPYRDEVIPLSEVRADAECSFEMLLRVIADLPVPGSLTDISERVGRRRAQLGVPLDVLLQAVRLDFRILWAALNHHAEPKDTKALMDGVVTVWEAVEKHTVGVHVSYLDEAAVLAREREQQMSYLVSKLFSSNGTDARVRDQIAATLDVDANAEFAQAVAHPSNERALRRAADRLRAKGIAVYVHVEERRPIMLAELPHGRRNVPAEWLRGVPCGLGPIARGLAAVPRCVRVAVEISEAIGPNATGPTRLHDVWPDVVAGRLSETGDVLADEVLSDMDAVTEHERRRLEATAGAYFASESVAETAERLYCHRNTVLTRLRRLGELTGGNLNQPAHAALVLLGLCVRDRRDAKSHDS